MLPKCAAAPTTLLHDNTKAHLSAMLSGNCCCRCMYKAMRPSTDMAMSTCHAA